MASHLNIPAMKLLISNGADVNSQGSNAGQTPLLRVLATRPIRPEGPTPLEKEQIYAAAQLLLTSGADPDKTNFDGTTPMMFAAGCGQPYAGCNGHIELLQLLLEHGAQIDRFAVNQVRFQWSSSVT